MGRIDADTIDAGKPALSRRGLLKGLGVGAAVAGFSTVTGSWVTADAATRTPGLVAAPRLEGTLEYSPGALAAFGKDFGGLVHDLPKAVLRPGSVADIVKVVQYARRLGLKVAVNGQGGRDADVESHSCYGQAQVRGGVSIDAKALATIHTIGSNHAVVGPGVTWGELVTAGYAKGKTPPALTDYLHLSIGGTVSVGGIGGGTAKYGLQADTVQEIEVVTGDGRVLTATPTTRADLFHAALAGGGQVGIITRLKVKMIPAPTSALVFSLFYDNLGTFLADQEKLLRDGRFEHQSGELARKPDDSGWWYRLEAVSYAVNPDQAALLNGLRDVRSAADIYPLPYLDWVFRANAWEDFLKENDFMAQPHPWLSLIMPASTVKRFVESVVPELTPADLGAGFSVLSPINTAKVRQPLFSRADEPIVYLFDLLRFPPPGETRIAAMLEQNRRLYDRAVAMGGKRYLVGAIPGMTRAQWRRHFGPAWDGLLAAKRRYDPDHVLTPGQGFFG
ncbi:putative oxidoreductase [Actinokineospora spheciospongiae]|uniref:Putative oxidoreductase n=1 Tax=Actinokineospora spheciospongiae TaxID=909613 RepID=W7IXV0_9PSEU|nr:FAD-binding protein [Actinokineospora spheciospongiae]EWC61311.1 putative oxidoreductase [Actinokineospora spheciospongiae]